MQTPNKERDLCSLALMQRFQQVVCPLWFPQRILRVNQQEKEKRRGKKQALKSRSGVFWAVREDDSEPPGWLTPLFPRSRLTGRVPLRSAGSGQRGFCDQRSLAKMSKRLKAVLLPESLGCSPRSQRALMSEAAFCFLSFFGGRGWGWRGVETWWPSPRMLLASSPSVTWEILAAEILTIHPYRFRGASNVSTRSDEWLKDWIFNLASEKD